MRAKSVSLKEAAAVVAAILLNAFILSQLVGGLQATQPSPAFAQPYGIGQTCVEPIDCISGNCVDDTCCLDPSCPPGQSCGVPGHAGTCAADIAAPAPTLSLSGRIR